MVTAFLNYSSIFLNGISFAILQENAYKIQVFSIPPEEVLNKLLSWTPLFPGLAGKKTDVYYAVGHCSFITRKVDK